MSVDNKISLHRGNTHTAQVPVTNNGAVMDITGFTAKLRAKKNPKDANAVLELDAEAVAIPELGIFIFKFKPTDTENIDPGWYMYDIDITKGENETLEVYTVVYDELQILPNN